MGRKRKNETVVPGQLTLFDFVGEIQEKLEKKDDYKINPGSMNISVQLRNELSEGLKKSAMSRHQVAAQMSELTGADITKTQLDSWTAESKECYRFPAEYLPAYCQVTGYKQPLRMMAQLIQCYLLESKDALLAELGKIDQVKKDLVSHEKRVRAMISQMEMAEF